MDKSIVMENVLILFSCYSSRKNLTVKIYCGFEPFNKKKISRLLGFLVLQRGLQKFRKVKQVVWRNGRRHR